MYSDGVSPTMFLKVEQKFERDLKPTLCAIASMVSLL